ncbi:MAG: PIN domain-containing protein [Kineosporiaceae bacterium]
MAVTSWLVDKSALWKLTRSADRQLWQDRIERGLVHVCLVTELEVAVSARHYRDVEVMADALLGPLVRTWLSPRSEAVANDIMKLLVVAGFHRSVPVPDVLVAAVAVAEGLTVLHDDRDFERIAEVYGAPEHERLRV